MPIPGREDGQKPGLWNVQVTFGGHDECIGPLINEPPTQVLEVLQIANSPFAFAIASITTLNNCCKKK
jgi:hypothetical protein